MAYTATSTPSVQFLRYDYDLVGNVNWIQDGRAANQQQNFLYDTLDRLTQANVSGGDGNGNYNESYTYDSAGRLLNGPLRAGYTYGDANHLHAVTAVGSNSYAYDANGNVTSRTVGGNTYTLSYDAENRLTSVSGAATASLSTMVMGPGSSASSTPQQAQGKHPPNKVKCATNPTQQPWIYPTCVRSASAPPAARA